jgi:pyruvate-formate lyase-activating enzyme
MPEQTDKTSKRSTKSMTIIVTAKCPLRCRHCAVGISGEPISAPLPRLREDDVKRAIHLASTGNYEVVNFAGGEPFLVTPLVAPGIAECRSLRLKSFITTAPIWAKSMEKARTLLAKLPGLDYLILSYDKYHLEFLEMKHYENALNAAYERNIDVIFNICYSFPHEKIEAKNQISRFSERIHDILYQPILPVGNARLFAKAIPLSVVTIEELADLDRLERSCTIGDIIIGLYKEVHACCWASAVPGSPFRFDYKRSGNFKAALRRMEHHKSFRRFCQKGLIDSLPLDNRKKVFNSIKGKQFVNECHLCMYLMGKSNRELWNNYIRVV